MPKKRILIVQPNIGAVGGGNALAAWAIQALIEDYEVTLAMLGPIDVEGANRSFGTSLAEGDFEVRIAPAKYQIPRRLLPTQGALLESNLTVSWARELDREGRFAALFSTQNEADFGRAGIQYIHFPSWYKPRPAVEMKWFHYIPGLLHLYRKLCFKSSGTTKAGVARNLFLANSSFVADRIREVFGQEAELLYPPVPGTFPEVPWSGRRPAMIAVGRFAECKRWGMAVEIIEAVRQRGHDLGLSLVGQIGERGHILEKQRLEKLAASRPWFRILSDLTREQLVQEIASHRYGIHTMEDEHFGIAVAELQRAGCITFVHRSGGPMEIVGNDPRVMFDDTEDAAEKIACAIEDRATGCELRALVESRRESFSTERFCSRLREVVARFVHAESAA